ncbi:MAG: PadR family transcriptional regulator [Acholeplasmataceae bacterium]
MISSDTMRGYNDTIILAILASGPSYGYEISKTIKERSQEKYVIKETTLYSAFNRLQKNGYIRPFTAENQSLKRRTYFAITPRGEAFLKEKIQEWRTTQEVVDAFIE